jgi:PAS domain S-box-containing protein
VQKVDLRFAMAITLTITVGISHILLKKEYTKAASYLFLCSFWMVISATLLWRAGSIRGPVMASSIVVTLLAGLLLGTRGGVLFACLHLLTGALLVYGEMTGQITYTPAAFPLVILFLYTVLFGITLAFLYAYKAQLQTALTRALDSEQQLLKNNLTLMYEVEKRKQIEAKLSEEQAFLESLAHTSPNIIYVYDLIEQKNVWQNQSIISIAGYSPQEVQEKESDLLPSLIHPDDIPRVIEHHSALRDTTDDSVHKLEYRLRHQSGHWKWLQSLDVPFRRDEENHTTHILGIAIDITERKQTEQQLSRYMTQLEAKNSELKQFSYLTSHDLQEPLRTLINFSSILQEEYQDKLDEDGQLYLSFIHDASQRMRQLVHGLLRYSQVGKNQPPQSLDCNQLISSIIVDLGLIIAETNATISYDQLPTLEAYPVEFRLLLQNLLENAIKFRHPNTPPHIEIKAEETQEHWLFSVRDNGIGIAPKHQDRIFTIFQRLHTAKEYPGTGIGLAKCKKIVDLHGGRIWVESIPGEGSSFFFTIAKQQITPALTDTQS